MKAALHHLFLGQKVAFSTHHMTVNRQIAHTFCTCVKGNNSPNQQMAVVCICHSKYADIQIVLAFTPLSLEFRLLASVSTVFLLMHWFAKLNGQSQWSLSQTDSTTDSTCSIGQKATDGGASSANITDHVAWHCPTADHCVSAFTFKVRFELLLPVWALQFNELKEVWMKLDIF